MPNSSNSSNSKQFLDQNSANYPYYFHHSNNHGLVLVSQVFTGENYASWSRSMIISLSVKNKFDFVDGKLPSPDNSDLAKIKSWIKNNDIVILCILNSVSKEISTSVIYLDTIHATWKELKERFQQSNVPRVYQI